MASKSVFEGSSGTQGKKTKNHTDDNMSYKTINELINGKKSIEEEIRKRLKTKNAFKENSGPPDYSELLKISKQNGLLKKFHSKHKIKKESEKIQEFEQQTDSSNYEIPEIIIPAEQAIKQQTNSISQASTPQAASKPYIKGDNIFLELLNYYQSDKIAGGKSKAIIEEDHNCLLSTVAAASRLSQIIEGPSRSGKSLIADKLGQLLTSVYKVEICSNKALFSDAEEINKNDFMYISEFQAALENNPDVKETIKLLTEHKDATNKANGKSQTIEGKITIISTGADENARTQKRDVEVSGRFILLRTRSDYEKIKRIAEYQNSIIMGEIEEKNFSANRYEKLKTHLKNILTSTYCFENPFARAYSPWLPETQKSIHYRTLYMSLIDGFTLFDEPNRTQKGEKLITNLADVYLVHTLYHQTYCDTLKKLSAHSYHSIEKNLPDIEREQKRKTLEDELKLADKVLETPVDWQTIWNAGYQHMQDKNPALLDEWKQLQTKGKEVMVYDPIKKQDITLCTI